MRNGITIIAGLFWVLTWFGFMLLYTFLDVAVWRKLTPASAKYLNLVSIVVCMAAFLHLLRAKTGFEPHFSQGISFQNLLLAAGCALALYLLLDRGIDPLFEKIFPASEDTYQETLQTLSKAPIVSLLHVCLLAPVIEELLMRGFLLGGLSATYGTGIALALSSFLFALLHFNMVQTLSALICGAVLGMLYLHTGSIVCCIAAHMGYNLISYLTTLLPLFHAGS